MTTPIGFGSLPLPPELATLRAPMPAPAPSPVLGGATVEAPGRVEGPSFEGRVQDFLRSVNDLDGRAHTAADGYMRGTHDDVHGTLIAMQEADISLRFAANVRNRVIEAYREVMRMGA
jgi:flagellar hook-basal body complex protein FliE